MALYDQALNVAKDYMGPASGKFMDRQLAALGIDRAALGPQHLDTLSSRCYTSGKLVMEDGRAKEFSERIRTLS